MHSRRWFAVSLLPLPFLVSLNLLSQVKTVTVPAGTLLRVRLNTPVGPGISRIDDVVEVELIEPELSVTRPVLPMHESGGKST
jgi:hypothetical protein